MTGLRRHDVLASKLGNVCTHRGVAPPSVVHSPTQAYGDQTSTKVATIAMVIWRQMAVLVQTSRLLKDTCYFIYLQASVFCSCGTQQTLNPKDII